jgi:CheY-like chemotaxis protein
MARILHVEDNSDWRELVRRRLGDHHVDSAASLQEAVDLLQSGQSYQVALVDLNLETDSDQLGGEILDLIQLRYPDTRRIVVTGSPPPGPVRKNVFERFDAQEILIKRDTDIPELRRVIEEAIGDPVNILPQPLRLQRSGLKQRFRDWERDQASALRAQIQNAEEHLEDTRRVSAPIIRQRAQRILDDVKAREVEFTTECRHLRELIDAVSNGTELAAALEALDAAEDRFGDRPLGDSRTPK